MANVSYQVKIKNHSGNVVASFAGMGGGLDVSGLSSLSYSKRLRSSGATVLNLYGLGEGVNQLFLDDGLDFIISIERRDLILGTPFSRDFSAFHRGEALGEDSEGNVIYTSYGMGLNCLLATEEVAFPSGSSEADKSGDPALLAYEFVDENIGPGAGVDADGESRVRPNLSLSAVGASGATWAGARSYKNLQNVLQELADFTPGEYMIEDHSPLDSGTFDFAWVWHNGIYGKDLRPDNADGNPPVIFSARLGTATNTMVRLARQNDLTTVYALGGGVQDQRKIVAVNDVIGLSLSPWARRAVSRNWSNEQVIGNLTDAGEAVIKDQKARFDISFDVVQTAKIRYKSAWDLGDLVRFEDRLGREFDIEIIGVNITMGQGGQETIKIEGELYDE